MVVWRITGDAIGPNGNGAAHFATKAEAANALGEAKANSEYTGLCDEPEKLTITNREQLAAALDEAMGYGST